MFEDLVFGVGGLDSSFGLFAADARPCELLDDTVDHELVVGEVEVRVHVAHVGVTQFGHVRADDERIVGDDRAVVVVVRVGHEVVLVTDARVEDRLHALVEQPFDVAVHQLGRVADVLGGDDSMPVSNSSWLLRPEIITLKPSVVSSVNQNG